MMPFPLGQANCRVGTSLAVAHAHAVMYEGCKYGVLCQQMITIDHKQLDEMRMMHNASMCSTRSLHKTCMNCLLTCRM